MAWTGKEYGGQPGRVGPGRKVVVNIFASGLFQGAAVEGDNVPFFEARAENGPSRLSGRPA